MMLTLELIFIVIAATFGLLFNGYILLVLTCWGSSASASTKSQSHSTSNQNANNLLLLHLAIVDILLCVTLLASNAPSLANTPLTLVSSSSVDINDDLSSPSLSKPSLAPEAANFISTPFEAPSFVNNRLLRPEVMSDSEIDQGSSDGASGSAPHPHVISPSSPSSSAHRGRFSLSSADDTHDQSSPPLSPTWDETDDEFVIRGSQPISILAALIGFIWSVLPVVIIWNVVGLSFDRYAAINSPLHYNDTISTRWAVIFISIAWTMGLGVAVPPLAGICPYGYSASRGVFIPRCASASDSTQDGLNSAFWSNHSEVGYIVIYATIAVLLPLAIVTLCNVHILVIARSHRHRIIGAIYEVTLKAQSPVTKDHVVAANSHWPPTPSPCGVSPIHGCGGAMSPKRASRRGSVTVCSLIGSLGALVAPAICCQLWDAVDYAADPHKPQVASTLELSMPRLLLAAFTTMALSCFPCVNAYIYGVKSKFLRSVFKRVIQRYLYKQQASMEIDRRLSLRSQSSLRNPTAFNWHSLISSSAASLVTSSTTHLVHHPHHHHHVHGHHCQMLGRGGRRYSAPLNLMTSFSGKEGTAPTAGGATPQPLIANGSSCSPSLCKQQRNSRSVDLVPTVTPSPPPPEGAIMAPKKRAHFELDPEEITDSPCVTASARRASFQRQSHSDEVHNRLPLHHHLHPHSPHHCSNSQCASRHHPGQTCDLLNCSCDSDSSSSSTASTDSVSSATALAETLQQHPSPSSSKVNHNHLWFSHGRPRPKLLFSLFSFDHRSTSGAAGSNAADSRRSSLDVSDTQITIESCDEPESSQSRSRESGRENSSLLTLPVMGPGCPSPNGQSFKCPPQLSPIQELSSTASAGSTPCPYGSYLQA